MPGEGEHNGWTEWRKHVLLEIERINENLEKLNEKHISTCLEITKLRAYAVTWGAIGGAAITVVVALIVSRV